MGREMKPVLGGSPVVSRISVPGHRGGADSPAGRRSVRVDSPVGRHSVRSQAASVGPARGSPATVSLSRSGGHSDAIAAYSVRRWYGSGKTKNIVLKDLDMALPRGKIYGLLGPSGCGKSTLLKCVTGRLSTHAGTLDVFGKSPGSPDHEIPGRLLGYMPQEEALYPEFTVSETLAFCASLHGVVSKELDRKKTFLYGLLELEGLSDRLIKNLSGGQKRRVSFACALVHNPQLLVLDEPTVGVDPLLRAKIWAYLQHLTSMPGGPSILITTHYIEEARQADIVGMMRDGNLLAEDAPETLLAQYSCMSLEEVFLLLCRGHGKFTVTEGQHIRKPVAHRLGTNPPSMITYQGPSPASKSQEGDAHLSKRETRKKAKTLRERLLHFYKERNPDNTGNIDAIMLKFEGREEALWANLLRKYPTRIAVVDEDDMMTEAERMAEQREKDKAAAMAKAAEKLAAPPQSYRWRTEVWNGEDDLRSSIANESVQDAHEAAVREQLLGKADDGDDDVPLLDPTSIHGWVPYKPVSEKPQGSRFCRNTCALAWKNFTKLRRSIGFMVFLFVLPAFQIALFCLAIGGDPTDLDVAVFNEDPHGNYSKLYLDSLDSGTINQVAVSSAASGLDMVHHGHAWGFLRIPAGFTASWNTSALPPRSPEPISLRLDSTQQQISLTLQLKADEAFTAVIRSIATSASANPAVNITALSRLISTGPVDISDPIYGSKHPSFTNFVAPGIMVTIGFAQAIGLTAIAFVQDRKDGLLDRCWAAGVKPVEIVLAHVITQFMVLLVQIGAMLAVALEGFELPLEGSLFYVAALMLLLGLTGMSFGLLISASAESEVAAMQMAMGTFFPSMLLSGVIWPIEAIPEWLRYISYALPTTWAAESMRSVMLRGWDISYQGVWAGFAAVAGYIILLLLLASRRVRSVD